MVGWPVINFMAIFNEPKEESLSAFCSSGSNERKQERDRGMNLKYQVLGEKRGKSGGKEEKKIKLSSK